MGCVKKVKTGIDVQYTVAGITMVVTWQAEGDPDILCNEVYLRESEAKKLAAYLDDAADKVFALRRKRKRK